MVIIILVYTVQDITSLTPTLYNPPPPPRPPTGNFYVTPSQIPVIVQGKEARHVAMQGILGNGTIFVG